MTVRVYWNQLSPRGKGARWNDTTVGVDQGGTGSRSLHLMLHVSGLTFRHLFYVTNQPRLLIFVTWHRIFIHPNDSSLIILNLIIVKCGLQNCMNGMLIEICKGSKSLKFYAFNFINLTCHKKIFKIFFLFIQENLQLLNLFLLCSFLSVMKNSQFFMI